MKTLSLLIDDYANGFMGFDVMGFQSFATFWPNLEYIGWQIYTWDRREVMYELDAIITGLPTIVCKQLAEKFRDREHLSPSKAPAHQFSI